MSRERCGCGWVRLGFGVVLIILTPTPHSYSGVTRIFRPVGKLRLFRKKTMGKMGKVFIDGPNEVLIT
jgi:hypothetical protein